MNSVARVEDERKRTNYAAVVESDADARYEHVLGQCEAHGGKPKRYKHRAQAHCPLHADTRPSVGITHPDKSRNGKVLVHCFVCKKTSTGRILAAWGLTFADLACMRSDSQPTRPRAIERYPYVGNDGMHLVARKTRQVPKGFVWERPDPTSASGWREGLDDVRPALYCNSGVLPRDIDRLFIVEGEKAVNRLTWSGLSAVCGPNGANTWTPELSALVMGTGATELVILADHDKKGRAFARDVARLLLAARRALKREVRIRLVVDLPVNYGEDVYDFLDRHSVAALLALVDARPDEGERLRADHAAAQRRYAAKKNPNTKRARIPATVCRSLPTLSAASFASAISAPARDATPSNGRSTTPTAKTWAERMAEDASLHAFVQAEIARAGRQVDPLTIDALIWQRDFYRRCAEEADARRKAARA